MAHRKTCNILKKKSSYNLWMTMKQRCFNPRNKKYKYYGNRGITICDRWLIFVNFYVDMGEKPQDRSIERINNNGNYEPGNCKWATSSEQNSNSRNTIGRTLTYNGISMSCSAWSRKLGIPQSTIATRLQKKYTLERILSKHI